MNWSLVHGKTIDISNDGGTGMVVRRGEGFVERDLRPESVVRTPIG